MQVDEETKKAIGLNDQQYINQFPFEACLVMKHHLAETVQKVIQSFSNYIIHVFGLILLKLFFTFSGLWIPGMVSTHL